MKLSANGSFICPLLRAIAAGLETGLFTNGKFVRVFSAIPPGESIDRLPGLVTSGRYGFADYIACKVYVDQIVVFIHAAHILSLLWRKLWVMYAREKETVALMQNNLKRFRSKHTASLESMKAAIEEQFNDWKLSKAESSVARQLILGYSFQRIASANGKSVKTIQNHATSIYNKAMVNGRSDLAAFFLCDLFED